MPAGREQRQSGFAPEAVAGVESRTMTSGLGTDSVHQAEPVEVRAIPPCPVAEDHGPASGGATIGAALPTSPEPPFPSWPAVESAGEGAGAGQKLDRGPTPGESLVDDVARLVTSDH